MPRKQLILSELLPLIAEQLRLHDQDYYEKFSEKQDILTSYVRELTDEEIDAKFEQNFKFLTGDPVVSGILKTKSSRMVLLLLIEHVSQKQEIRAVVQQRLDLSDCEFLLFRKAFKCVVKKMNAQAHDCAVEIIKAIISSSLE